MSDMSRVRTGDPLRIPASTWNKVIDATRAHYASMGAPGVRAVTSPTTAGTIFVRNDSGADQPRHAVLGIDRPIILPTEHQDEFLRQVALAVVLPKQQDHQSRFVVTAEPLAIGAIGRAYVDDLVPVQINVVHIDHVTAGIVEDETTRLESGHPGVEIIWKDNSGGGVGVRWGIVRLGAGPGSDAFWAQLGGATSIGDNRWSYVFTEVEYQHTGSWIAKVGGRTGTAYNTLEANNSASGVQGNGIHLSNLPTGVAIVSIGAGAVVQVWPAINCDTGEIEYVFEAVNQVDGACVSGGTP